LSAGINKNNNAQEDTQRLDMWLNAGLEARYGYFCVEGARQGIAYTKTADYDHAVVNNFDWLRNRFVEWTGLNE
jgi:hypothetical protein